MTDRFGVAALACGLVALALYASAGPAGCPSCGEVEVFLAGGGAVVGPVLFLVGLNVLRP